MTDKTDFWEGLVTIQYQGQAAVREKLDVMIVSNIDILNVQRPACYGFEKMVGRGFKTRERSFLDLTSG